MQIIADAAAEFAAIPEADVVRRTYRLLDAHVEVRYGSPTLLAALHPALAHLAVESAPPDLVLQAWTSTERRPAPPAPDDAMQTPDHGWYAEDGGRRAFWRAGILHALDLDAGRGWLWAGNDEALDLSVVAAPFRPVIEWWGRSRGYERVHGAAIATENGGVLVGGVGGSGKSTTSLVAAHAGFAFAGDDAVFVSLASEPSVHGAYNTAKLESDHAGRVPWLEGAITKAGRPGAEKALAHVHRVLPERCVSGFPLRAVVVARVSGRPDTTVTPLSGARALARLAPSSLVIQAGDRGASLATMAALVRSVPCHALEVGLDVDHLLAVLGDLCRTGAGATACPDEGASS